MVGVWHTSSLAHVPQENDDGEDLRESLNMSRSPGSHMHRTEEEEEEVSESLLGRLPPKSERRRDETVLKLNSFAEWEMHRFILSDEKVFISHEGQETITDLIPLVNPSCGHII